MITGPDRYRLAGDGMHGIDIQRHALLLHRFEGGFRCVRRELLEKMGFECATRLYADGVDAAYFDTREVNGCFTEIHGDPPHILAAFAG